MNKSIKKLISELKEGFNLEQRKIAYKALLDKKSETINEIEKIINEVLRREYDVNIENEDILIDCFLILRELNSESSLELILRTLKKDSEFLDYFFEEYLSEYVWLVLAKLGKNNMDKLISFVKDKKIDMYSRLAAASALVDIESRNPKIRKKVLSVLKELLYEKNKDLDFNIMIMVNIMDMGGKELEKEVMEVFDKNEKKQDIMEKDEIEFERTYFSKYGDKNIYKLADEIFEEIEEEEEEVSNEPKQEPRRVVKVGRNEPCPCGSGKKYKKCCGK